MIVNRFNSKTLTFAITFLLIIINSNAQTKSETIKWITSKFVNTEFGYGDRWGNKMIIKNTIKSDGTFKKVETKYPKRGGDYIITLAGNLKDMNPSTVKVIKDDDTYFFIELRCSNGSSCVKQHSDYTDQEDSDNNNDSIWFGPFKYSEKDLEQRLVKAFTRLVIMSGGKKEAF